MNRTIKRCLMIGGILMLLSGCFKSYTFTNITQLSFRYTKGYAMYADVEYTLRSNDNVYTVTIKPHGVADENADTFIVDEAFVNEITQLLSTYKVEKWNNYRKSDLHVLDGDSFDFHIINEKGESLSALGYEKWPKNYREVKEGLDNLFMSLYSK